MYHFTYQTKNLINGKTYVGLHSTKRLTDNYLGSGVTLKNAIKKHGKENFEKEILSFFDSREEARDEEMAIIDRTWVENPGNYNARIGGDGSHAGYTVEKGHNMGTHGTGRPRSEETKEKIRRTMAGRTYSEARCRAMSEGKLKARDGRN